ncbi:MAG: hypothetical protein IJX28_07815 [Clostridia bacterium]|nr:hypothetical protein [Clostridia bacterium]
MEWDKEELPKRKKNRLENYDYSSCGSYFITICTQNRRSVLSRIVGGDVLDAPSVELLPYGKIADKYINQLSAFYDNILVERYVIMPNHIHMLLFIKPIGDIAFESELLLENGASRTSPPTRQHSVVSGFVSTFKRYFNKECGIKLWQRGFYDHIIRNSKDYEEHINYILQNPMRWYYDVYMEE